ncbi:uncharacterized protein VTP21DRAFT_1029 [Calcarisporiella thermophila]|uniref:uncharacterized protein n=1 Tax=Calcarisporiella thermophila TaxID=911321 RepID=UPI00374314D8
MLFFKDTVFFSLRNVLFSLILLNFAHGQSQNQYALPIPYTPLASGDVKSPVLVEALTRAHQMIDKTFNNTDFNTASVAIVQDQSVLLTYGNATSYYSIGSCTKLFIGLLMMLMRDAGKLSLEDRLTKFIPTFRIRDPYLGRSAEPPTLRMLASHTAGLPRDHCPLDVPFWKNYSEADVLAYLANTSLLRPPWSSTPSYSNLGIALLAHALETVCGGTWGECLKTHVWDPLDMGETGAVATRDQLSNFAPNPYGEAAKLFDIGYANPSGSMYSTLTDLVKFVKAFNRNDLGLKPYSIDEWARPQTLLIGGTNAYGMPFEIIKLENESEWVVTKNGRVPGQNSIMMFYRPLKISVVALCSGEIDCDTIGLALLKEVIPAIRKQMANEHAKAKYAGTYAGSTDRCEWQPGSSTCNATLHIYLDSASDSLLADYSVSLANKTVQNQPAVLIPDESNEDTGRFFLVDKTAHLVRKIGSLGAMTNPKGVPVDLLRFEAAEVGMRVLWGAFGISMTKQT